MALPPATETEGTLRWASFEAQFTVMWSRKGECGLKFGSELSQETLLITRSITAHSIGSELLRAATIVSSRGD